MLIADSTVLYAEDDEDDRFFLFHAFKEAGLQSSLRIALDGRDAIDYLSGIGRYSDRQRHPVPHLVLLDLNLPQVSGFEVLAWIRKQGQYSSLPVVALTSSTLDSDRATAQLLGCSDYLVKPVSRRKYTELAVRLREKWLVAPHAPAVTGPRPPSPRPGETG